MSDNHVVSITRDRSRLLRREEEMDTPIYDQLRAELQHDPLKRTDPSLDAYYLAHQRYVEAKTGLDKLLTVNLKTD